MNIHRYFFGNITQSWMLLLLTMALTVLQTGCETTKKSFYESKPSNIVCKADEKKDPGKRIVVVEFTEDGRQEPSWEAKAALRQIKDFEAKIVLLYAHGWHNNADPDSINRKYADLNDLNGLLDQLRAARPKDKVLAIYLGWRGKSRTGLLHFFTLDTRRDVAGIIGRSDKLHTFLGDVAAGAKEQNASVVFAGHSLGAALMEKAAEAMICGKGEKPPFPATRLPHLFLLVNSAERTRVSDKSHDAITQTLQKRKETSSTTLLAPQVLAVGGQGDLANYFLQPISNVILHPIKFFDNLFHGYGPWAVSFTKQATTHLVVNTHQSQPTPSALVQQAHAPASEEANGQSPQEQADGQGKIKLEVSSFVRVEPNFWVPRHGHQYKWRIEPKPISVAARVPGYWGFKFPRALAKGHDDVYNEKFLAASLSWFSLGRENIKQKTTTDAAGKTVVPLPINLEGIIDELKKEVVRHPPPLTPEERELDVNKKSRETRSDLVMGAALRMPYNVKTFTLLLTELHDSSNNLGRMMDVANTPKDLRENVLLNYRANLFTILKRTYLSDVWNSKPQNKPLRDVLRRTLQMEGIQDALNECGNADSGKRETDRDLKEFKKRVCGQKA